uniref:Uncharacterized protein n=1 Tax=viral metagenome TaxID=1070528 RepID=A0A6C0DU36_9ZZZZ
MVKAIKTKKDRLSEGINILKQLRDNGVKELSPGFQELKTKISEWVSSEGSWDGNIDFREYGRIAEVELPKYDNKAAGLNFKVKKAF